MKKAHPARDNTGQAAPVACISYILNSRNGQTQPVRLSFTYLLYHGGAPHPSPAPFRIMFSFSLSSPSGRILALLYTVIISKDTLQFKSKNKNIDIFFGGEKKDVITAAETKKAAQTGGESKLQKRKRRNERDDFKN